MPKGVADETPLLIVVAATTSDSGPALSGDASTRRTWPLPPAAPAMMLPTVPPLQAARTSVAARTPARGNLNRNFKCASLLYLFSARADVAAAPQPSIPESGNATQSACLRAHKREKSPRGTAGACLLRNTAELRCVGYNECALN